MYKEMYVFESSCLVGFCISLNQEPTQVTHMKGAFHIWSKTRLRFKLIQIFVLFGHQKYWCCCFLTYIHMGSQHSALHRGEWEMNELIVFLNKCYCRKGRESFYL